MWWIVGLLVLVVAFLWSIRNALEPVREHFAAVLADAREREEQRAADKREERRAYQHFLAGSTPERAQAMMEISRRMDPDAPKGFRDSRNNRPGSQESSANEVV